MGAFGRPGTYPGSEGYVAPEFAGGEFTGGQGIRGVNPYMAGSGAEGYFPEGLTGDRGATGLSLFDAPEASVVARSQTYPTEHYLLQEGASPLINVGSATQAVMQSPMFEMLSQLTAEAQQLEQREGSAYDDLYASTIGELRGSRESALETLRTTLEDETKRLEDSRNEEIERLQSATDEELESMGIVRREEIRRLETIRDEEINALKASRDEEMARLETAREQELARLEQAQRSVLKRLEGSFANSVVGPIKEGAAQAMKMSMDTINNMYAQGGTARNKALQEALRVQAQIDINMQSYAKIADAQWNFAQVFSNTEWLTTSQIAATGLATAQQLADFGVTSQAGITDRSILSGQQIAGFSYETAGGITDTRLLMEQAMANFGYGGARDIAGFRQGAQAQIADTELSTAAAIANSEAALDQWIRGNVLETVNFNVWFANNVAGSRQAYLDSALAATAYMGQVAIPSSSQLGAVADSYSRNKKNWLTTALGVAALAAAPFTAGTSMAAAGGALLNQANQQSQQGTGT